MSEVVEFVVEARPLKIKVMGEAYLGRFPFYGEKMRFLTQLKDAKPEDAPKVVDEFISKLGFPQEAIDQMDDKNLTKFIELLMGKKN